MRQTRTGSHGSSLACCGMTTKPPLLSKRPPQLAFDLAAPAVWALLRPVDTVSTLHVSHASCSGGNVPPTAAELCVRNSISLKTLFQNMTLALLNPEQHVIAQSIGALALWGFTVSAFGAVSSGSGPCATVWPLDLRRSEQMRRRVPRAQLATQRRVDGRAEAVEDSMRGGDEPACLLQYFRVLERRESLRTVPVEARSRFCSLPSQIPSAA